MKEKSGTKAITMIAAITVMIKLIGMLRQLVYSYFYGATVISDAINISQTIPITLFSLVTAGIGSSLIPMINHVKAKGNSESVSKYISNVINVMVLASVVLIILVELFPNAVLNLFVRGFNEEAFSLSGLFLRISIFIIIPNGLSFVLTSLLKNDKEYFITSIAPLPLAIVEIISYFIAYKINQPLIVIYALISGYVIQFLLLYAVARKNGFQYKVHINLADKDLRRMLTLAIPVMIGAGLDEINVIVDKNIASSFAVGSISLIGYSTTIINLLHSVVTISINTPFFTDVSQLAITNENEKTTRRLYLAIDNAFFVLLPAVIGLCVFAKPINNILYLRGSITNEDTSIIALLTVCYAMQIIPNALRIFIISIFQAYKKTQTVLYINIFAIFVNVVSNYVLSYFLGVCGVALSTSLSVVVSCVISAVCVKKYVPQFKLFAIIQQNYKYLIWSVISVAVAAFIFKVLQHFVAFEAVGLFTAVGVCVVIYFSIAMKSKGLRFREMLKQIRK